MKLKFLHKLKQQNSKNNFATKTIKINSSPPNLSQTTNDVKSTSYNSEMEEICGRSSFGPLDTLVKNRPAFCRAFNIKRGTLGLCPHRDRKAVKANAVVCFESVT